MPIDSSSGMTKHVITQHNHWVDDGKGRGALCAYTFCGWLYLDGLMEGACAYGEWWRNGSIPDVCPHCVHILTCERIQVDAEPPAEQPCPGCAATRADDALGHPFYRTREPTV